MSTQKSQPNGRTTIESKPEDDLALDPEDDLGLDPETVTDLEPAEGRDAVRGGARATAYCTRDAGCHEVGHWLKPPG